MLFESHAVRKLRYGPEKSASEGPKPDMISAKIYLLDYLPFYRR